MTVPGADRWVSFVPRGASVGERKPQLIGTFWKNCSPSGAERVRPRKGRSPALWPHMQPVSLVLGGGAGSLWEEAEV